MRVFTLAEAAAALPEVERLLRRLQALLEGAGADGAEAEAILRRLGEIGCVLRDIRMGLVDFPARAGGMDIFLCWRLGEEAIGYWHGTGEGYAGRKPLARLPGAQVH